jgi:hypothetical protein
MIQKLDGILVEQTNLDGIPPKQRRICPKCGRVNESGNQCRGDRMKRLMKLYVKREFELNSKERC